MPAGLSTITSCEVCGNEHLTPVLDLGLHPMCDDLVPVGDPRICREYPIDILYCDNCRTAHQRFQVPKDELFPTSYHYRSRFTADVLNGMKGLVATCAERFGALDGKTVLDIGCNDGSLLDFFRAAGAATVGIEPTGAAADAEGKGHTIYEAFLDEAIATKVAGAHGNPDFITFTNVFAHIEDLRGVIASLKALIGPNTVIAIENHYLGAVLDGNQFDTFYHEHPRTYSFTSFVHMARSLGLELLEVEFPKRYGGNIRVFMGNASHGSGRLGDQQALDAREAEFGSRFATLAQNVANWRANKRQQLDDLVAQHGPLRAKAFPGRAAILVKLLGLDTSIISVVHEKPGSLKIGNYLPGTRIPIRSDDELFALADKSAPLINLAWHIPTEIHGYLIKVGYSGPIIDILSPDDLAAR
ncbi:class I SAM-dependent methyltransferase [Devosia sp.]|uniref:class I SAM-dependent methyltransferase n=1 Tax=Devosia sp. TaxID=1871048 RepID=UPI002634660D|nr:class I SAM-dependent methyltransferase [Devosia sp.]